MTNRENNIRHISEFLRDIQQITEYSSNRNTFNVNINYYENYYNRSEEPDELYENDRVGRADNSDTGRGSRYFIEINGEQGTENNVRNAGTNSTNSRTPSYTPIRPSNRPSNSSFNRGTDTPNNISLARATNTPIDIPVNIPVNSPVNITGSTGDNPSSNPDDERIVTRQITIPFRTNNLSDLNNTSPVNLTNSLADITDIINRTLSENLNNINLDKIDRQFDGFNNASVPGLTITERNTKTALIVYSAV